MMHIYIWKRKKRVANTAAIIICVVFPERKKEPEEKCTEKVHL